MWCHLTLTTVAKEIKRKISLIERIAFLLKRSYMFSRILPFRTTSLSFCLIGQGLGMRLIYSFIQMFSEQVLPYHPTKNDQILFVSNPCKQRILWAHYCLFIPYSFIYTPQHFFSGFLDPIFSDFFFFFSYIYIISRSRNWKNLILVETSFLSSFV